VAKKTVVPVPSEYLSEKGREGGKIGGKKRWEGVSKAARREYAKTIGRLGGIASAKAKQKK